MTEHQALVDEIAGIANLDDVDVDDMARRHNVDPLTVRLLIRREKARRQEQEMEPDTNGLSM